MVKKISVTNKNISTKIGQIKMSNDKSEKFEQEEEVPLVSIQLLFDEIDSETSREICAWILNANFAKNKPDMLNLIINSPGGNINDAYAIIDIMKSSSIPVRTIGLGQIQSAGLMIFMSGTKGERILTPNTSIMSHQYSWGAMGKHNELVAIRKEFDLTYHRMMEHYKTHTKLKEKDIIKYLLPSEDCYLSSEEALKLGVCDRIALVG